MHKSTALLWCCLLSSSQMQQSMLSVTSGELTSSLWFRLKSWVWILQDLPYISRGNVTQRCEGSQFEHYYTIVKFWKFAVPHQSTCWFFMTNEPRQFEVLNSRKGPAVSLDMQLDQRFRKMVKYRCHPFLEDFLAIAPAQAPEELRVTSRKTTGSARKHLNWHKKRYRAPLLSVF